MRTIKLYAHEEHEGMAVDPAELSADSASRYSDSVQRELRSYINRHGDGDISPEELNAILAQKPLYEVEFTFDVDTGKCIEANVAGVILKA